MSTDAHDGMWTHTDHKGNVDILAFAEDHLLLVRRKFPPFKDWWVLPGGRIERGEKARDAACREFMEECGIRVEVADLVQTGVYNTPGRDPRGPTTAIAFARWLDTAPPPTAGDDAAEARWFPVDHLPALGFDHERIAEDALRCEPT